MLGVLILLYALASLAPVAMIAAFHLGRLSVPADTPTPRLEFMAATGWLQIAIWFASIALYLIVAIKLFRRAKAFVFWAAAFALSVITWLWAKAEGFYESAMSPSMLYADYVILAANLAVGALIWILGRTYLD